MQAIRVHERGGPEGFVLESAPDPEPATGDAIIRVRAASFTPTELEWPSTWVDRLGRDRCPVIPGHEVSGIVEALGYGTMGVAIGDEVYGVTDWYRDGTFAELVAVEARNLALKPATLTHAMAAAVPLAALTAWQALFDLGQLQSGWTVVIHGAAGGVGTYAVQLAHAAGARVVATGRSAEGRSVAAELGADLFVNLREERLEQVVSNVDLVFDLVGAPVHESSVAVLKPGGALVSVVTSLDAALARRAGVRSALFVVEPNHAELVEIGRRVDAGELKVFVGSVTPLAEASTAFSTKQRGGSTGKAVIQVAA
ncbi:MAG TPA: NADP-dependent oxidoreductase [Chloroflexota bacterium]|jgi:NADPH:quinone reductase-like Zn-dependent oxidoreductase